MENQNENENGNRAVSNLSTKLRNVYKECVYWKGNFNYGWLHVPNMDNHNKEYEESKYTQKISDVK